MLGWPKRCKLSHAFLWECSYKKLKLAQLLGQPGGFLTWVQPASLESRPWLASRAVHVRLRSATAATPSAATQLPISVLVVGRSQAAQLLRHFAKKVFWVSEHAGPRR